MNISLGFICGESGTAETLSRLSLYSAFLKIEKERKVKNNFKVIRVLVVDESNEQSVIKTAIKLFGKRRVTKIKPNPWENFGVPPMSNGSFATYYKFDIFKSAMPNELVLYLDSDTLVNRNINTLLIKQLIKNETTVLLMVPSPRPVIERLGYMETINPFAYYNAGVIFYKSNKNFNFKGLMRYLKQYLDSGLDLIWHDQDLINTYFNKLIKPLPLEYNLSTGMLRKKLNSEIGMNYVIQKSLTNPYILHASGGVLFKPKQIYPFKIFFQKQFNDMMRNIPNLTKKEIKEMKAFKDLISSEKKFQNVLLNRFRMFFGTTQECHPNYYKEYHYKNIIKKFLKSLAHLKLI